LSVATGLQSEANTYRQPDKFADKPTRGQSSRGLGNTWTSQLAETFDLKFEVNNHSKCDFL